MIPETLKIGCFDWKVEESEDVARAATCFAHCQWHSQKLFVSPSTSLQKKQEGIIHEVLHALFWQTGLNERFRRLEEGEKLEEEITQALAMGLYGFLRDNPTFIKMILEVNNDAAQ